MRGWRVGIAVTLCMGLIVHTTAVALGWRSSSSNLNWPLAR
jgi:hypothetical protein